MRSAEQADSISSAQDNKLPNELAAPRDLQTMALR